MTELLLVHAASTLYMVGLIWFVQVVHYPLYDRVGGDVFPVYQQAHMRRTSWVVGPAMLAEAATTVALLIWQPTTVDPRAPWLGAALLAVVWLSTRLQQVPRHAELSRGFDADAHRRLVTSNWLRTVAWSARGALSLYLLAAR